MNFSYPGIEPLTIALGGQSTGNCDMAEEKPHSRMTHETLIPRAQLFKQYPLQQIAAPAIRRIEGLLAIDAINAWYDELVHNDDITGPVFSRILSLMGITYQITSDDLAKIPLQGPLVVVANHPFGGLEGIILGDLLQHSRPDAKILGNYLLHKIEPIRDSIVSVDPFGRRSSVASNARTFRTCLKWLRAGHCLITFPAGEVAHYRFDQQRITDPEWSTHIAALIRMSGAQVLPIYFPGRNSLLFNLMGMIHPRLRTILLGRELAFRQRSRVRLFVGRPIANDRLIAQANDGEMINWLRLKTFFLSNRITSTSSPDLPPIPYTAAPRTVIEPVNRDLLAAEIAALASECCLLRHKQMAVYVADSEQIPHLLREIGRLREQTFREVGEGTGKAMDVDLFDSYYHHLILWNAQTSEVVGAYRMGETRDILSRFGRKGLYTHSLFKLKSGLLQYLDNSLELGRSFIRSEYQRQPNCLALLWKGIGAYLVRHPGHRILFGPVSISNSYHRVSKNIIVQFLQRCCTVKELSAHVNPRCPYRPVHHHRLDAESIDDVSMMVSEIEDDGKRVPVLIKHYLKLNGQFIAFNVDRDFADAIDGLVVVDLLQTEVKLLDRFMGSEGRRFYREHWLQEPMGAGLR